MNKALQNYECEGQLNIFDYLTPAQEYYFDTGKTTYWQDSQNKPYQWWKNESPVCSFSGHTCNKENLWDVADTLDEIKCPHECCRQCEQRFCGARCNGSDEPKPFMNPPEDPKTEPTDDYIKEHPTCFYVFGHYLDREDGWHKVPDELPTFTEWTTIDVVLFGKKTGTPWMEHGKWEAKDWTFRSLDERRDTESTEFLAWKVSD